MHVIHPRRLVFSLILGFAVGLLPTLTTNFPESGIYGTIGFLINFLLLPGLVVSLVALRNVHAIDIRTVHVIDIVFYVLLFYFLLRARARRESKSRTNHVR